MSPPESGRQSGTQPLLDVAEFTTDGSHLQVFSCIMHRESRNKGWGERVYKHGMTGRTASGRRLSALNCKSVADDLLSRKGWKALQ